MSQGNQKEQTAAFETDDLEVLATTLRNTFDIRDRKYGLSGKTYAKCFVGQEAVKELIGQGIASGEEDAVRIGNMLVQGGIFHHVLDEHPFKNEYLFYRFAADEDHGAVGRRPDGEAVSWADFLEPLTDTGEDGQATLQANIPDRSAQFARFEQVDLAKVGIAPLDEHNAALLDCAHPKTWCNPEPKDRYNLVVIGAGAGGLVTAAAAAGVGARVALVERHLLGGDCLNVGCVPSKALLRSAKAAVGVRRAADFGVVVRGDIDVDFPGVMERMRRLRASIAPHDSAKRYAEELGVDVFIGTGIFTGRNTVQVNDRTLRFTKAVVATGGTAAIPPIPGLSNSPFYTNASIFSLTALPKRLGVIGAGPIGLEMAQAFERFGSQVCVLSQNEQIMPREDMEAAQLVEASMVNDGVVFETGVRIQRVESKERESPATVVFEVEGKERRMTFDALLVATGRKPAVAELGLEAAGIAHDERTGIRVDDRLQTTNPSVYAVGDVATKYQFTHMADFMARLVVRNALFFGRDKFSSLLIPWATYTDPEVAHVGLYERDLEARKIDYVTIKRDLREVDRSLLDGEVEGFVKIHVRKGKDEILGATIVGPNAGDKISEITLAMHAGVGMGKLANVIHPYPTSAEAIRQCGDIYNRTRLTPTVRKVFNRLMTIQR